MKNIKYTILLATVLSLLFSCEESKVYNGNARVKFGGLVASVDVTPADLVYKLEVQLVSAPLKKDVVCVIIVRDESTAIQGVDFVLEASTVTIPAGQNLAYVEVKCLYEGLSDGGKRTAVFELKGLEEGISAIPKVNVFSLSMMMKCPFVPEDFEGTYMTVDQSAYEDDPYDPYEVELTLLSYDEPTKKAIYESLGMWGEQTPVQIILQEHADGSYHVSIPKQEYDEHATYGTIWIENINNEGAFSPCELVIQTNYKVYVEAGYFDQVTSSVWTKK